MSKRQKTLLRIIICAAAFAAAVLITHYVDMAWYVSLIIYAAVYLLIAYDILLKAARNAVHGQVLDENLLMIIATVGAFVVAEYPEAILVMWLYQIGELFQSYAVGKSRKSIGDLMNIRPDSACVLRDGAETVVSPEEVSVGEIIVVRPGERVPLDGVVIEGVTGLDTAALTGESAPKTVKAGDAALSGCISLSGVIKLRCEKEFYDSTVSKILDLVENASSKKAKAENFITKFARYYTPVVVAAALLLAVVPSLITHEWNVWIYRALSFLVASCPCALVISVPLSFFGGIGGASAEGVLVKGGNYLELLAKADVIVMDKTGTVTKGVFEVQRVTPENKREQILALAAAAESGSNHPIALSVLKAAGTRRSGQGYAVEEIAGKGIRAQKEGSVILCGNDKLMTDGGVDFVRDEGAGSVVYVAENGKFVGSLLISDAVKEGSAAAIEQMKKSGCKTYMLTGDNALSAAAVAAETGIDVYRAQLLPADKVTELEAIMEQKAAGSVVAFVGDGINDAPVLTRADIGIAMGGVGSDSAIEAADVVLMHDDLGSINTAKKIARRTMTIVKQNIIFALVVKAAVLVLSALGFTDMWMAIFADVGVMVLAVLNAMRNMRRVNRRGPASSRPPAAATQGN